MHFWQLQKYEKPVWTPIPRFLTTRFRIISSFINERFFLFLLFFICKVWASDFTVLHAYSVRLTCIIFAIFEAVIDTNFFPLGGIKCLWQMYVYFVAHAIFFYIRYLLVYIFYTFRTYFTLFATSNILWSNFCIIYSIFSYAESRFSKGNEYIFFLIPLIYARLLVLQLPKTLGFSTCYH